MTNSEKILALRDLSNHPSTAERYHDLFERMGDLKRNYGDYMTTAPIDCDQELMRVRTADYDLCCALLTMLFREDHFMQDGAFERRCKNGDVQAIIDRMVTILIEK